MKIFQIFGLAVIAATAANVASADMWVNIKGSGTSFAVKNPAKSGTVDTDTTQTLNRVLEDNGITQGVVDSLPNVIKANVEAQKKAALELANKMLLTVGACSFKASVENNNTLVCKGDVATDLRTTLRTAFDRDHSSDTLAGTNALATYFNINGKFGPGTIDVGGVQKDGDANIFYQLGISRIYCAPGAFMYSERCTIELK